MVDQLLRYLLTIFSFSIFVGCQAIPIDPPILSETLINELEEMKPPMQKVPIAVYSFVDLTGQRKPSDNMALISTAVTQGAHVWLLQALKSAGKGKWFTVVERGSLDLSLIHI